MCYTIMFDAHTNCDKIESRHSFLNGNTFFYQNTLGKTVMFLNVTMQRKYKSTKWHQQINQIGMLCWLLEQILIWTVVPCYYLSTSLMSCWLHCAATLSADWELITQPTWHHASLFSQQTSGHITNSIKISMHP